MQRAGSFGKDPDAGKDWGQEKEATDNEMVGWHHWLNGQEFEQTLVDGERQRNLVCCSQWDYKELDMTALLNNGIDSLVAQMVKKKICLQYGRFDPWVGKIPWRKEWQLTPVCLPGELHGQRSLACWSPWESDTTEWLTLSHFLHRHRHRYRYETCLIFVFETIEYQPLNKNFYAKFTGKDGEWGRGVPVSAQQAFPVEMV